MAFSEAFRHAMLEYAFGGTAAYTAPLWIGLSLASPGADGSGFSEVPLQDAYARFQISNIPADWGAPSAGSISNANAATFPTATGAWGEIFGYGLFDAATGGNMIAWADLQTSKVIGDQDTASFGPGALDFTFI